jgi:hypothetical protein
MILIFISYTISFFRCLLFFVLFLCLIHASRPLSLRSLCRLEIDLCRCNGGSNYGLDVASYYCSKYSLLYQRTTDNAYYTSSTRWKRAAREYDYYTKEITQFILHSLEIELNATSIEMSNYPLDQIDTAEYETLEDQYALLTLQVAKYATPVREFACSLVYPRCARCEDIIEDPAVMFTGNQENLACYDPTTCRSLCKKVLKLHETFSDQFRKCVVEGQCTNATSHKIFHSKLQTTGPSLTSIDELCRSELICPWRSLPGHRQYDNSLDDERSTYDFSPLAVSFSYLTIFGIMTLALTLFGWVAAKYMVSIWTQRRQFGATDEIRDDSGQQRQRKQHKQQQSITTEEAANSNSEQLHIEKTSTFAFEEFSQQQ